VPDPSVSDLEMQFLLNQPPKQIKLFHQLPSNLAFHDLTCEKKVLPNDFKAILGIRNKFIKTRKRSCWDLFLNVFFAGCEYELSKSKLYIKSEWTPEDFEIPCWTRDRLDNFLTKVTSLFKRKQASANLLPFQQKIMDRLMNYPDQGDVIKFF
jgi:hypothetical protein